jgi:hypothetical protein
VILHRFVLASLALVVLLLGAFGPVEPPPVEGLALSGLTEPVVVRVYYHDRADLDAIAGGLDIWEVQTKGQYAIARVQPAEYQWLASLGYRLEIDAGKTALLGIEAPLDPRFYYFDDHYPNANGLYMVNFLEETEAAYPGLTELVDIGDTWIAENGGYHRDLWVLRVSNEDPAFGPIEGKPAFYLFANIHAREVATPELAIRYIKYLTSGYDGEGGYGLDPDVTWLVNHNVIYVQVSQNPDGHVENEMDIGNYRRKNMDNDDGCSSPSLWGVDLNRNSSFFWNCCGGSEGDPCNELYHGPSQASEPETQAFQDYFTAVMEDQNGPNGDDELPPAAPITTTGIFLSLHQYGDLVIWPYGFSSDPAPNNAGLRTIGRKFAYYNGYNPAGDIYLVDGATDDWTYGRFGVASFTYEIGTSGGDCGGFFPAYGCIDGIDGMPRSFWAENKPTFIYAHKIARTPYMTSYGPDAESVVAMPGVAVPGAQVDLTATIADHRYAADPLQPIHAAEYFVDAPGEDGSGTAMSPRDGSWGDLSEEVEAAVDTTGLAEGQHYLLVHGRNEDGDWGPFTAVFLYITDPLSAPTLEGYVLSAGDSAPLAATVTANAFQTNTDPATGYYSTMLISDTYNISAVADGYAVSSVTGVEIISYQTIRQDFYLWPACAVTSDDVEAGNLDWTAEGNWAITAESSHSPTHSWTDSPGGIYGNNWDYSLISPVFDLSNYEGVTLSFWHAYDLEDGYDFGYVEYSSNGGGTWASAATYNGQNLDPVWAQGVVPLPALDGQSNARIRFRLDTDLYYAADGWHIDDILLSGGSPDCVTPLAPVPEFSTNSPVTLGNPLVFANLTEGTLPMDFAWDFGDGSGTSTHRDPEYTYSTVGSFTVTLVATNTLGSDSVQHLVDILDEGCVELTAVSIEGDTGGETGSYVFSTSYEPPNATPAITYLWDNGDAGDSSTRMLDVGTHTLMVTATNCAGVSVTDTHTILIAPDPDSSIYLPMIIRGGH